MDDYRDLLAARLENSAAHPTTLTLSLVEAAREAARELRAIARAAREDEYSERAYRADVASLARLCAAEAFENERDLSEVISETVDGNAWVIYYHAARRCLAWSENEDAIFESGADLSEFDSVGSFHCAAAYHALETDVRVAIEDCAAEAIASTDRARRLARYEWIEAIKDSDGTDLHTKGSLSWSDLYREIRRTVESVAREAIAVAALDVGLDVDGDDLPDALFDVETCGVVPPGCRLATFAGVVAIVDVDGETEYLPRDDYDPRNYEDPTVESVDGYLARWTMPGYLDCGDWHFGETALDALLAYIAWIGD